MGTVTTFNLAIVISEQRKGSGFKDLGKDMDRTGTSADKLGDSTERASTRMERFKERLRTVGKMLKNMIVPGLTIAAMAFLKFSKETFLDFAKFDQGIRETFTLLPGISEEVKEKLTRDAKSIAREYGRLPEEVLPAMYQALSAGIPKENVVSSVELAARAATAGVAELEATMVTGQAVVNAYGGELYNLEEVYDIIFLLIKNGVVTMDDLNKTLQNVTSVAAESDTPFEDIAAALVVMTRQGDSATEATELLQLLLMQLATDGTSAFRAFQEASGIAYRDFIAEGGNLIEALIMMEEHADATGQSLSSMIAGDSRFFRDSQAGRASMELTGKHLQDLIDQSNYFKDTAGSMGAAFKEVSEGVQYDVDKMSSAWDVLKIEFGEWVATKGIAGVTGTKTVQGAFWIFSALSGGLRDDIQRNIEARLEEDDSLEANIKMYYELIDARKMLQSVGAQTLIDIQGLNVLEKVAESSKSLEEFEKKLVDLGLAYEYYEQGGGGVFVELVDMTGKQLWEQTEALIKAAEELKKYELSMLDAAAADSIMIARTNAWAEAQKETNDVVKDAWTINEIYADQLERSGGSTAVWSDELGRYTDNIKEATNKTELFGEAVENLTGKDNKAYWSQFAMLSPEVMDYFDSITSSSETLFDTYGELAEAEGTWIDVFLDNSDKIKEANEEIAGDLTQEQKEAMWDIVDNVTEGGEEWLAAWDAIQGDITKTQRNELIAQRADLEASHETWAMAFTGDAKAAEEAKDLIAETLDEIAEAYDNLALAIFERELFEDLPGDTYDAQIALLKLKEEMGLMLPGRVSFLTSQLETAKTLDSVLTTMYSNFTANNSPLSDAEITALAKAMEIVENMEAGVGLTQDTIIAMATTVPTSMATAGDSIQEHGIDKLIAMEAEAAALVEEPYEPEIEIDEESTTEQLDRLEKYIDNVTRKRTIDISIAYTGGPPPVQITGEQEHASGGTFKIPSGFPNDTHGPHYFQSGEVVNVLTPAQQQAQGMQGNGQVIEGDTNIFHVSDRSTARFVSHLIHEKKRQRFNNIMGR